MSGWPNGAVSVPIRGLFNLTCVFKRLERCGSSQLVSVPIRGLFNLTRQKH